MCYMASLNFYFLSPNTTSFDFFNFYFLFFTLEAVFPYRFICFAAVVVLVRRPGTVRPEMRGKKLLAQRKRRGKLEDESEAESMSTSPWAESNKLH